MCLAVPMRLIDVNELGGGQAELDGVQYAVNLSLIDDASVGDYVIVHAGFAIEKFDEVEAEARLALFKEMAETIGDETGESS